MRELRAVCLRVAYVAAHRRNPVRGCFGLPDTTVTTTCSYCGVGCSLNVNVKDGSVVNIEPNPEGSANKGHTCVKGRFAHQFAHSKDRLHTPLIKGRNPDGTPAGFREASWEEALGASSASSKFSEISASTARRDSPRSARRAARTKKTT